MLHLDYHEWLLIALASLVLLGITNVCYFCCRCFRKKKLCSCFRKKKLSRAESKSPNVDDSVPLGAAATETHTIEVQGMAEVIISLQELRKSTNNFSSANVIGEGVPALVYNGEHIGIKVFVKYMVSKEGKITNEHQIKQFESEIVALLKVDIAILFL